MPTPSLILVPARFKTGKLYTPLATTSGGVVLGASGDFNVTRATTATRVNASGFIEVVASGIPRLDYPIGGGCPALLVEPAGTNLLVQSQNWLASGWRDDATANVTTVSATTGTLDPLGTNTANAISPTSGNTSHLKVGSDSSITFVSGTVYTESAFFKQGVGNAGRYVQLAHTAARFAGPFANFDLELGAVAVVSGTAADTNRAASIENYGNGWYRCRLTATCSSAGLGNGVSIALIQTSGATRLATFSGTTTDVLYGWGAQIETGSIATSYIPTTTAAATRNADVINLSGEVSGCIGQTEGTIYAEFRYLGRETTRAGIVYLRQTASRGFGISLASNAISFISRNISGSTSINLVNGLTFGAYYKIAIAYDAGGTAAGGTEVSGVTAYVNGSPANVSVGDLRVPDATISEIRLHGAPSGSDNETANANIRAVALYTTRLTNAQLAALTTP